LKLPSREAVRKAETISRFFAKPAARPGPGAEKKDGESIALATIGILESEAEQMLWVRRAGDDPWGKWHDASFFGSPIMVERRTSR
jgi:hypothetical protein